MTFTSTQSSRYPDGTVDPVPDNHTLRLLGVPYCYNRHQRLWFWGFVNLLVSLRNFLSLLSCVSTVRNSEVYRGELKGLFFKCGREPCPPEDETLDQNQVERSESERRRVLCENRSVWHENSKVRKDKHWWRRSSRKESIVWRRIGNFILCS